jgi:hypothetical protein
MVAATKVAGNHFAIVFERTIKDGFLVLFVAGGLGESF